MTRQEFVKKAVGAGLSNEAIKAAMNERRQKIGAFDDEVSSAQSKPVENQSQLKQSGQTNPLRAGIQGFGQGVTMGLGDEATAKIKSIVGGKYEDELAKNREYQKDLKGAYPAVYSGAEIAGSLISPVGKIGKGIKAGKGALSVLKSIGSGTAQGAISAYGGTEKKGMGALKDVGIGSAIGAGSSGIGNLIGMGKKIISQKAEPVISGIRTKIAGLKLNPSDLRSPIKVEKSSQELYKLLDKEKLSPVPSDIGKLTEKLDNQYMDLINKKKSKVDVSKIINDFDKRIKGSYTINMNKPQNSIEIQGAADVLNKLAKKPTVPELNKVKYDIQNQMKRTYDAIEKGVDVGDAKEIQKILRDALDKTLNKLAPKGKKINDNLKILHDSAYDIYKKSNTGGNIPILTKLTGLKTTDTTTKLLNSILRKNDKTLSPKKSLIDDILKETVSPNKANIRNLIIKKYTEGKK